MSRTEFQQKNCHEFDKLSDICQKDDVGKETWIAPWKDISIHTDYDKTLGAWSFDLVWHGGSSVKVAKLNAFSFNQLCRRLKCPAKFMIDLPGSLAKQNLDFFKMGLQEKDVAIKVKHHAEGPNNQSSFYHARGIVGPSTPLLSNADIIGALKEIAGEYDMRVWKAHFRDHDFHAKIIWGEEFNVGTMNAKDNANIGIHITNSEVGSCQTTLQMMVFRIVCKNGLVHMIDGAPLYTRAAQNISRADVLRDIKNALHTLENRKDGLINKFDTARSVAVSEPFKVISRIALKYGVGRKEQIILTEEFNRGRASGEYQDDKIGIVNAITKAAQTFEQNKRLQFEVVAGRVLYDDEILEERVVKNAEVSR